MATTDDKADAAAQAAAEANKQVQKEVRTAQRRAERDDNIDALPLENLMGDSHGWFGQPPQVLAAGLELTGNANRKNLTVAEGQEAVDAFLAYTPPAEKE